MHKLSELLYCLLRMDFTLFEVSFSYKCLHLCIFEIFGSIDVKVLLCDDEPLSDERCGLLKAVETC